MVNDGQPFFNLALRQMFSRYENQSWSTIFQCRIGKNIYLRVYIPLVYNIYPLGLVLFPWVYNPLGLLLPWFYNIYDRIYIPWVYNINLLGLLIIWFCNIDNHLHVLIH